MQIFVKNVEEKSADEENGFNLVATVTERKKRTESLIKRINRLQWKQLESHTTEQLVSFCERQAKLCPVSSNNNFPPSQSTNLLESQEIQTKTQTTQTTPTVIDRTTTNVTQQFSTIDNNFTPSILDCAEDELLRSAVGILTANLKHLEYSYDSDATESSSGGESCDEFENVFSDTFSKPNTSSNILEPIERKANWRWLNERSAIASRWTWLQAQVADLEFKIRQQNEMYRQLRASKGSIAFYCKEAPTVVPSSIPNSLPKTSPITTTPRSTSSGPQQSTSMRTSTTSTTLTTTSTTSPPKPTIQIPPPSKQMSTPPSKQSMMIPTTTATSTTPTTTPSTTFTDSLSIDVSTFKFAKNVPSISSDSSKKFTNILGSTNGTLNSQNLSSCSGPNSNGLSDYSLPSVNSDSTISLSPPLETMASSTRTKTPSPSHTPPPPPPSSSSHLATDDLPHSSSLETPLHGTTSTPTSTSTTTTTPHPQPLRPSSESTSTPTTTSSTTFSTTISTTTTATCTTTASLTITPQKQSGLVKEVSTPSSEERHDPAAAANPVNTSEKEIHHCARTLPLKQMRKRKLVRSCNAISSASRKVARYSTVQCSCTNYPRFVSPCVLCNGRFSHLQMVDTDCMPNYERYALLDPSYHPVLSLPTDVALGLYFSKILKKDTTTVQKPLKSKITGTTIGTSKSSTLSSQSSSTLSAQSTTKTKSTNKRSTFSEFPFKFGLENKKTQLNRGKSQAFISSTKLKKKYDGTTKKKYAKKNNNLRKRLRKNDQPNGEFTSPLSSENSVTPLHRRRRSDQNAYDINNIVIPYSIASTTRVEKLQYKEIITPKWRCVEIDPNSSITPKEISDNKEAKESTSDIQQNPPVDSKDNIFKFDHESEETDEDISDEAFAIRHAKCEIDERRQRNLHLHQKSERNKTMSETSESSTTTATTKNHQPHSPLAETISSSPSLTQNSHSQPSQ